MLAHADDPADALTATLDAHLRAIAERDLDALAATVHPHDDVDQRSVLSLVFRREDGRWFMVQDQNTPVRGPRP
jgi:ketosteroid isomerase-like protein